MNTSYPVNLVPNYKERRDLLMKTLELLESEGALIEYILEKGKKKPIPFPDGINKSNYTIAGCQYKIWVYVCVGGAGIKVYVDSDSVFIRGFLNLYRDTLSGLSKEEMAKMEVIMPESFVKEAKLSSRRMNGVEVALEEIKRQTRRLKY